MSGYTELLAKLQEYGEAFKAFRDANDERVAQIETQGRATAETLSKLEKTEAHLDEVRDRISQVEADIKARKIEAHVDNSLSDVDRAHSRAFNDWLRKPKDPETITALKMAEAAAATQSREQSTERRGAVTITTTGGGNAIPTEVAARMERKIYDLSPVRQVARVNSVSNENIRFIVLDNNATGGWAAAGGTRSETVTPLFQSVTLTYGTAYAHPQVQEEAMDDIAFDVAQLIEDTAAEVLAAQEGTAFVTGNGTSRPTGFLNGNAVSPLTVVSTGDEASPQRAFGSIQYFATGAAAGFQNDAFTGPSSPVTDPAGVLFDVVYGLKAQYRARARWMMSKATLGTIRKFRDTDGNYLYIPGLVSGQPDRLLGYPITEAEDMPTIAANACPVAFADFMSAYQIGDIVATLRITVDDNITAPGFWKFYIRRRVGGNLLNDDAIKVVKCAAS